jgi:hypothetical protein
MLNIVHVADYFISSTVINASDISNKKTYHHGEGTNEII